MLEYMLLYLTWPKFKIMRSAYVQVIFMIQMLKCQTAWKQPAHEFVFGRVFLSFYLLCGVKVKADINEITTQGLSSDYMQLTHSPAVWGKGGGVSSQKKTCLKQWTPKLRINWRDLVSKVYFKMWIEFYCNWII